MKKLIVLLIIAKFPLWFWLGLNEVDQAKLVAQIFVNHCLKTHCEEAIVELGIKGYDFVIESECLKFKI